MGICCQRMTCFSWESSITLGHVQGVTTLSFGYRWPSEEYVKELLEGKSTKSLVASPTYRKALSGLGKGSFLHAWLDIPSIEKTVREGLGAMGVDMADGDKVMKHLGVDNLDVASLNWSIDGGMYESVVNLRTTGKPHGAVDLLTRPADKEILNYIPVHDAMFQCFGHAPVREIVDFALTAAQDISGEDPRPDYQDGLAQALEDGFDIENDLYDSLGSTFGFGFLKEGAALITTLSNAEKFDNLITKAIASGGESVPLRPASHDGVNYRVLLIPLMGLQPCIGTVENAFVVATSPNALERIIDTRKSENTLAKNEWLQSIPDFGSKDTIMWQYSDANGCINQLNVSADLSKMSAGMGGGMGIGGTPQRFDVTFGEGAYPDGAVGTRSDRGYEFRTKSSAMFPVYITLVNFGRQLAASGAHSDGSLARRAREKAEQEAAAKKVGTGDPEKDLKMLAEAVETFQARQGNYPSELAELVPDYIGGIPLDPNGTGEYRYYSNGIVYYIIAANGPDGDEDILVRSYRGGYEDDRAVRGKIHKPGSDVNDGDIVYFGPAY